MSDTTNDEIVLDITYPYLWKSVAVDNFTNRLSDVQEFIEKFKLFQKFIESCSGKTIMAIKRESNHCHPINTKKELELIKKIIKEHYDNNRIFETIWSQYFADEEFWQMATTNGFRVFGIKKGNKFRLLIFDYYHCIYPSESHNDKSIAHNDYSVYYKERQ